MFGIRIDIDTITGLREGVPSLLKMFSKYDVKVSFFCPMGWEGDFFSVFTQRFIRTRKRFSRAGSALKSGDKAKMWSLYNYNSVRDTLGVWSLSSIALNEYDCKKGRVIIRFLSVHSGNMGRGEVALINMNIDASEVHVPSGSISKISLQLACGK